MAERGKTGMKKDGDEDIAKYYHGAGKLFAPEFSQLVENRFQDGPRYKYKPRFVPSGLFYFYSGGICTLVHYGLGRRFEKSVQASRPVFSVGKLIPSMGVKK
ncbi:hypothetical protein BDZ45DRAFT_742717 [Acephala macrosclerotiorum]|nr:hypothetical protein BDZ45DRAFT_742717 [Acephala macrosclerotiorum]